jgi:hypothetical protein
MLYVLVFTGYGIKTSARGFTKCNITSRNSYTRDGFIANHIYLIIAISIGYSYIK